MSLRAWKRRAKLWEQRAKARIVVITLRDHPGDVLNAEARAGAELVAAKDAAARAKTPRERDAASAKLSAAVEAWDEVRPLAQGVRRSWGYPEEVL